MIDQFPPKIIIFAVYKTPEKTWRGFCYPYDVTCEVESKEKAKKMVEEHAAAYEEGLKKYSYPKHLSLRPLSDSRDKRVLDIALRIIAAEIEKKFREQNLKYQAEQGTETFTLKSPQSTVYYQPQPAFCTA